MSESKKSFILYADLIHTVKKMPAELAGRLFVHILEYVNDLNPETDELLLQISFEPIKQQLKRDLKDWEEEKNYRSEIGRLGGLKSAESRLLKKNKPRSTEVNLTQPNSTEVNGGQPNQADNVTVTVSVNGTVNEKQIPSEEIFLSYVKEKYEGNYLEIDASAKLKYAAFKENGWKDGLDKPIKNWKSKVLNIIPHLKKQPVIQSQTKTGWTYKIKTIDYFSNKREYDHYLKYTEPAERERFERTGKLT